MDDLRLGRIEEKLDKLAYAVVSLARMEERMLTLFKRIEQYEVRQEKLEIRVSDLEMDDAGKNSIFRIVDKATWVVLGVVLALFMDIFKK